MSTCEQLNDDRIRHNMTYQQLADASGVPVGTVKSILTGATSNPGFEPVCAMIQAMGESIDAFYSGVPQTHPQHHHAAHAAETITDNHNLLPLRDEIKIIAREAIQAVYQSDVVKNSHNNLKWWRGLALAETALIIGVLIFDLTHPNMGYIQYMAALISDRSFDIFFRRIV